MAKLSLSKRIAILKQEIYTLYGLVPKAVGLYNSAYVALQKVKAAARRRPSVEPTELEAEVDKALAGLATARKQNGFVDRPTR